MLFLALSFFLLFSHTLSLSQFRKGDGNIRSRNLLRLWKSAERICTVILKMGTRRRQQQQKENKVPSMCSWLRRPWLFFSSSAIVKEHGIQFRKIGWQGEDGTGQNQRIERIEQSISRRFFFRTFYHFISLYLCSVCHLKNSSSGFFLEMLSLSSTFA